MNLNASPTTAGEQSVQDILFDHPSNAERASELVRRQLLSTQMVRRLHSASSSQKRQAPAQSSARNTPQPSRLTSMIWKAAALVFISWAAFVAVTAAIVTCTPVGAPLMFASSAAGALTGGVICLGLQSLLRLRKGMA
jgi:hypothetical protein